MEIIREVNFLNNGRPHITLTTNCYGNDYAFIKKLHDLLVLDFPNLKDENIYVVKYGPPRRAQIMGVETTLDKKAVIPDNYRTVLFSERQL